jgi:hypothetical protein
VSRGTGSRRGRLAFCFGRGSYRLPLEYPIPFTRMPMISLRRVRAFAFTLSAGALFAACGDDDGTSQNQGILLKDATVVFGPGVNCAEGGASTEFNGVAGTTITATITAGGLSPRMYLYAPDYSTLLKTSTSAGPGKATLTHTLTESAVHYISSCEANGLGGSARVVVTQNQ